MGKTWDEIAVDDQDALLEWYNIQEDCVDDEDRERLADLFHAGNFRSWLCPECGERIMVGDPKDWGNFQGVCQSETFGDLCHDCAASLKATVDHAKEYGIGA